MENIEKLKIASIGKADPINNNAGHHAIVTESSSSSVGSIDVWFGDRQQFKTPEQALVYAKLIAAAPELLEALQIIINDDPALLEIPQVLNAIKKATE